MENEQQESQNREMATEKKKAFPKAIVAAVALLIIVVGIGLFFVLRGTPVSEIVFSEDTIELTAGDTYTLHLEILPDNATNKSITWQSSDPSVAIVSTTGEVTAISKGETVIMATTSNGKVDECLITVRPTAFDYMKELAEEHGFIVGEYSSDRYSTTIGVTYIEADDSLCIMNISRGAVRLNTNPYYASTSDTASIIIPSSLSGDYTGTWESDDRIYFFDKYLDTIVVHSTYLVDAATWKSGTRLTSVFYDGEADNASDYDELYALYLETMLHKVYEEILEPNEYTYADLGFKAFE